MRNRLGWMLAVAGAAAVMAKGADRSDGREMTALQRTATAEALHAGWEVWWNGPGAVPRVVRGRDLLRPRLTGGGNGPAAAGGAKRADRAKAVLGNLGGLLRIQNAAEDFEAGRVLKDPLGCTHLRMRQVHGGLPVFGGEAIVHFDAADTPYQVTAGHCLNLPADLQPVLDADTAQAAARAEMEAAGWKGLALAEKASLEILGTVDPPALAYAMAFSGEADDHTPVYWRVWVDARTGAVLNRYNDIQTADATIRGNVLAREGGEQATVTGSLEGGVYYLQNATRHWRVVNMGGSQNIGYGNVASRTTSDWGTSDRAEMSAARSFERVLAYYQNVHARNSIDNAGMLAIANVHYGVNYNNAFWTPQYQQVCFGDGDGTLMTPASVLDVAAHEYTHGVTSHSADLIYQNESGALNESFSDIFGVAVEFYWQPDGRAQYPNFTAGHADWLFGEEWLAAGLYRDLRNPSHASLRTPQPSRYKGSHWYFGADDNGGVHYNSGVQNHVFYLLSEGGSGNNDGIAYSVAGLGVTNAARIAYRALTVYCTQGTDHPAARLAWLSAVRDLNPEWEGNVAQAWAAVGIGEALQSVAAPTFSPPEGAFASAVTVTVASATAGAAVRYTLDGVEPGESSALYTAPLVIGASTTVKAKAFKSGMNPSATAAAAYSFLGARLRQFLTDDLAPAGWTVEGGWAFGHPTGAGGNKGPPDPTAGHTGLNVYGYNLAGDYPDNIATTYWLTTAPLDFSTASDVKLSFWRWLGVEEPQYDRVCLEVSNDGATWTRVWENTSKMGYSTTDQVITNWSQVVYDISAVADRRSGVRVRWGLGPTDGNTTYCGWNLDDVEFWGATSSPTVPEAPGSLLAAASASNRVELTWQDKSGSEQGFLVHRAAGYSVTGSVEVGRVGANATSFADAGVAAKATYTYRVAGYNAAGTSQWSNAATVTTPGNSDDAWDPGDDTGGGATPLAGARPDEQEHGPHTLSATDPQDWYRVALTGATAYVLHAAGGSGDTFGELFTDSAGFNRVAYDDDSAGDKQFSIAYTATTTAWHYLRVRTYLAGSNAAYSLKHRLVPASGGGDAWDPADNTGAGATVLPAPTSAEQSHGPHTLSASDGHDWFAVTLTAGQSYGFNSIGGSGDPYLEVFSDAAGTVWVAGDDDSGGDRQFNLVFTPSTTGVYYLRVRSYSAGASASYALKYSVGNDPWDPGDDSVLDAPTVLAAPTADEQTHGSHRLSGTDYVDWFAVPLVLGEVYNFNSIGSVGDVRTELWAQNWVGSWYLLAADDDSGGDLQFSLNYTNNWGTGWFYLGVGPYSAGSVAEYTLRYSGGKDAWDPGDNTLAGGTALGAPTIGVQSHGAHTLTLNDWYDWFQVSLVMGKTYYFNSAGGTGDTYGELYENASDPFPVAYDDDSAGDLQFGLVYTAAKTQTHYLRVQCYYVGDLSAYRLSYSCAVDGDGDGMPDDWEIASLGGVTNGTATSNKDRDKASDVHEYIAGTDPSSSNSCFFISNVVTPLQGGVVLRWPSVAGRLYSVERCDRPDGIYAPIASDLAATPPQNAHTSAVPPAAAGFYRVRVRLGP